MNINEIINYIEDEQIEIPSDCYYHRFVYNQDEFIRMLKEGIKSPILLRKKPTGYNGKFYVCLSKDEMCKKSAYKLMYNSPAFIIDSTLRTIKAKNYTESIKNPAWFDNSFLPFRQCPYDDEYQKFLKVKANYIIGIRFNLYANCIKCKEYNMDVNEVLEILKNIIYDLESEEIDLPIIDNSNSHIINKQKVLSL